MKNLYTFLYPTTEKKQPAVISNSQTNSFYQIKSLFIFGLLFPGKDSTKGWAARHATSFPSTNQSASRMVNPQPIRTAAGNSCCVRRRFGATTVSVLHWKRKRQGIYQGAYFLRLF